MRILITGGGGFIGSHLVDSQLTQGQRVRVVDLNVERLAHTTNHPNLEIMRGDITDSELVKALVDGVDVIYHLASAHLDVNLSDDYYRRINVEATLNLLQVARKAGVKRIVHCSSNGVLGEVKNPPANEISPCRPTNIYERTKLMGEQVALQFAQEMGFPVVVVRPAWVYGPRCPRTQKLIRTIGKGRFVMIGRGQTLRHPIYITDAICGLELCAQADGVTGQVYFIAGEEAITIAHLVQTIAEVLEVKPPSLSLPVTIGIVAGYTLQLIFKPTGLQPPFSRRSVDFFLKDNAYDISKARRELGFQPQVDLRSGLRETISWLSHPQKNQTNPGAVKG
jgi:nucleoside-diphosphate-sugar epimerase